jgi:hypothetical protein
MSHVVLLDRPISATGSGDAAVAPGHRPQDKGGKNTAMGRLTPWQVRHEIYLKPKLLPA